MAFEVTELSCQFVTYFTLKVVSVDTASVAVDVVLPDVVLADHSVALIPHVSHDTAGHAGVLLLECHRLVLVAI